MPNIPESLGEFPQATALLEAQRQFVALEERHKQELQVARAELRDSTRGLSTISEMSDRLRVAGWAYGLPKVHAADLAFAVCGNEKHQWQLRKMLSSPFRRCDRCEVEVLAGHRFEARPPFYCDTCAAAVSADQIKKLNDDGRRYESRQRHRSARIEELKSKGTLSTAEANELTALLVSFVDGPIGQLSDYVQESLDGRNARNPAEDRPNRRSD
jgi:hypothetical protein